MNNLYKMGGKRYFAAANTKDGFISYFDKIFSENECERLYILKGGPGVGKSTFMKALGNLSEEKGYETEYFHCSSDPESLDGIIIKDKRIAVVDGTSPHAVEPSLAGAREIIVDLGKAWDTDMLFDKKAEIERLSKIKKQHYKDCYTFLYSKSVMDSLVYNLIFPYILFDKLDRSAMRLSKGLFARIKTKEKGNVSIRITNAVSALGRIRLSTFEDEAETCVFLKEPFLQSRLAFHFLRAVYECAKSQNADVTASFNPESKGEIDALYFPQIKTSVSLYDEKLVSDCDRIMKKCKIVNCARFLDLKALRPLTPLRKFYCKLSENMGKQALESLEKAGKVHMEIEKIYRPCTDYGTVEKISDEIFKKIL